MNRDRSQAVVEARLGRPTQDWLEAAVVLEAWCGLRAKEALAWGRGVVRRQRPAATTGEHRNEAQGKRRSETAEGTSLVLAVVAVATWAAPLSAHLGASVWDGAVRLALPITIGLQWLIWSRHLSAGEGVGNLRRESPICILALIAMLAVLHQLGPQGDVAGALVLIWVGGTVLVSRRWTAWYALLLVVVSAALRTSLDPWVVLIAAAVVTIGVVTAALATCARARTAPRRWPRALIAGTIGAGLGVVLVSDQTIGWGFLGALSALALIPSTVGGFWAGRHLSRLYTELPRALEGVPVWRSDGSIGGPGLRILAGSVLRLVFATVVLSVVCVVAGPVTSGTVTTGLFVGFGCLALATLLVSLLVSVGRLMWALTAVSAAVLVEVFVQLPGAATVPGSGVIVGATVAVLMALPAVVMLLLRPGSTLATAVWIS
jgi:hypothetical protein